MVTNTQRPRILHHMTYHMTYPPRGDFSVRMVAVEVSELGFILNLEVLVLLSILVLFLCANGLPLGTCTSGWSGVE